MYTYILTVFFFFYSSFQAKIFGLVSKPCLETSRVSSRLVTCHLDLVSSRDFRLVTGSRSHKNIPHVRRKKNKSIVRVFGRGKHLSVFCSGDKLAPLHENPWEVCQRDTSEDMNALRVWDHLLTDRLQIGSERHCPFCEWRGKCVAICPGQTRIAWWFSPEKDRVQYCEHANSFTAHFVIFCPSPEVVQKYCRLHHFSSTPFLSTESIIIFLVKKPAFILCENNGRRPQTFFPPPAPLIILRQDRLCHNAS